MLHITMNLVGTKLREEFEKHTSDLEGLVKPEYLHSSLIILKGGEFSGPEMETIKQIASSASDKIARLMEFQTGHYVTDDNGYLMLEITFEGLDAIIAEMEEKFENEEFDVISKRPFHATIVKGVFGGELEVAAAMEKMNAIMSDANLKNGLCNRSFSIDGAVYCQAEYPKGVLTGTVQVIHAFHEFKIEEGTLNNLEETHEIYMSPMNFR